MNNRIYEHIVSHKDDIYLLDLKNVDGYSLVAENQKVEFKSSRTSTKIFEGTILVIFAFWNGYKLKAISDEDKEDLKREGYLVDVFLPNSVDYSRIRSLVEEIASNIPSELNSE